MRHFAQLMIGIATLFVGIDGGATGQVRAADDATALLREAAALADQGKSTEAIERLTRVLKLEPNSASAYYLRGRENFRGGQVAASVTDFEKLIELAPRREVSLWELGISYYYAEQYAKGARQFELYQTYHDSDVENAVWRYLCMAATEGRDKARAKLLPIANDPRVPLMEIYAMYQGKATPEDVFAAARRGDPTPKALRSRLFYAHLYVGLFHEAAGQREKAKTHLAQAAGEYKIDHYMGDVARVHAERLAKAKE